MNRRVLAAALCTALLASADHGRCQTSSGPPTVKILSTTTFDWNGGPQGWEGTVDFKLDSAFNKLGGHLSGNAWVTESPRYPRTYTSGATADTEGYPARYPGPNLLISPWLDLSGLDDTSIVLSFQQSIDVEPGWDGSWMEYSVDGDHWKRLGRLNDPNGTNWYASDLYKNAATEGGDPPDTATMKLPGYRLYGPGLGITELPSCWWTSNGDPTSGGSRSFGDGIPKGPFGWITCRLRITAGEYPDIVKAHAVRFRYVAFADAVNPPGENVAPRDSFEGWAIDNFTIGGGTRK